MSNSFWDIANQRTSYLGWRDRQDHGRNEEHHHVLRCRLEYNRSRQCWHSQPFLYLEYRQWSDLSLPELAGSLAPNLEVEDEGDYLVQGKTISLIRVSIFLIMAAFIAGIAGCFYTPPSHNLEIRTWYDLNAIWNNLAGHHTLMNDLDSTTPGYEELASARANQGKGWQPIGTTLTQKGDMALQPLWALSTGKDTRYVTYLSTVLTKMLSGSFYVRRAERGHQRYRRGECHCDWRSVCGDSSGIESWRLCMQFLFHSQRDWRLYCRRSGGIESYGTVSNSYSTR